MARTHSMEFIHSPAQNYRPRTCWWLMAWKPVGSPDRFRRKLTQGPQGWSPLQGRAEPQRECRPKCSVHLKGWPVRAGKSPEGSPQPAHACGRLANRSPEREREPLRSHSQGGILLSCLSPPLTGIPCPYSQGFRSILYGTKGSPEILAPKWPQT